MISGLRHKAFRAGLIMIIKELKEPVIKEVKKKRRYDSNDDNSVENMNTKRQKLCTKQNR